MNPHKEILDKAFALERIDWSLLRKTKEFFLCIDSPENQKWHAGETTDKHINAVINRFFNFYALDQLTHEQKVSLYLTALFHDFMKPACISRDHNGIVHQYNHEKLASRYIWDFAYKAYGKLSEDQFETILLVSKLIFWHMEKSNDTLYNKRSKHMLSSLTDSQVGLLALFNSFDTSRDFDLSERTVAMFQAKNNVVNYLSPLNLDRSLTICIGPSGCGKSTYTLGCVDSLIVSTDDIRAEFGDINDQSRNDEVFNEARKRIRTILDMGENAVFDATNLTYKDRKAIVEIGHRFNVPVIAEVFLTSYEECIAGQLKRDRQVPVDVVKRHYEKMELPSYSEFNFINYHYPVEK